MVPFQIVRVSYEHQKIVVAVCLRRIGLRYPGKLDRYRIGESSIINLKRHKLAKEAGEQIKKKEAKDLFFGDLKTVPGYN